MPLRRTPLPEWAIARRRELGRRPASARCTSLLSQDQLADRIGVERRTIQRYWECFESAGHSPNRRGDGAGAGPVGPDEPRSRPQTDDLHRSHPPTTSVSTPTPTHTRSVTRHVTMHTTHSASLTTRRTPPPRPAKRSASASAPPPPSPAGTAVSSRPCSGSRSHFV
ncbi:hypothetical protein C5746_33330 [Streptomyces atratus]|uniref:Helix-turn-helix domain-containing protein n=1 Tax=Streptomyces atratus TaxID=1893 RepID=A0A2Z5JKT5_STRAR|nr:hypothetical protein C5746_33330 [Streptomyces atratus]